MLPRSIAPASYFQTHDLPSTSRKFQFLIKWWIFAKISKTAEVLTSFLRTIIGVGFTIRDDEILLTGDVNVVGITVRIPQQVILKGSH